MAIAKTPRLIDEMHFDGGIYAFASSPDGQFIAVGSKGLLGLYLVKENSGAQGLSHFASFVIPGMGEFAVTRLTLSEDSQSLIVESEDGFIRTLSVGEKEDGMLIELSRSPASGIEDLLAFEVA